MPALMPITSAPIPRKPWPRSKRCSTSDPHDPYFLELKGQILLESGQPAGGARAAARGGRHVPDEQPLIAALLGHALISTEDPANFEEAKRVLRIAVSRDNDNPFAWYQLGIVYDREGDSAARRAGHRRALQSRGPAAARAGQCRDGDGGHPAGTPDYLRAQDIAMVSRTELKKDKKGQMT